MYVCVCLCAYKWLDEFTYSFSHLLPKVESSTRHDTHTVLGVLAKDRSLRIGTKTLEKYSFSNGCNIWAVCASGTDVAKSRIWCFASNFGLRYRTRRSAVDGDDAAKIWQIQTICTHTRNLVAVHRYRRRTSIHAYANGKWLGSRTRFHIVHTYTYLNECKMYECAWRASSASDMRFATFMRNIRYVIAENDTSTNGNRQPIQRRT